MFALPLFTLKGDANELRHAPVPVRPALREPCQMLADQKYGGHTSIHDDAMAEKLGFRAGPSKGRPVSASSSRCWPTCGPGLVRARLLFGALPEYGSRGRIGARLCRACRAEPDPRAAWLNTPTAPRCSKPALPWARSTGVGARTTAGPAAPA